jgi:hypothetical protein
MRQGPTARWTHRRAWSGGDASGPPHEFLDSAGHCGVRWKCRLVTLPRSRLPTVKGILNTALTFIASMIGWVIGAKISVFTAFVVSTIFMGFGLYASIRITKYYLP